MLYAKVVNFSPLLTMYEPFQFEKNSALETLIKNIYEMHIWWILQYVHDMPFQKVENENCLKMNEDLCVVF